MMNERTEQLYKEAVNSASAELHEWNKNWQPGKHTNFEYEKVLYKKFAELIVKECARVDSEANNVDHVDGETYNQTILQHFGIKK